MVDIPDLVRDSKLETKFRSKFTAHRFHEVDVNNGARNVIREEYWRRQSYIGGGSYGRVWLETCVKGGRDHDVRAVKEMVKSPLGQRPNYYNRELEAIAKFSHDRYVRCFVKSFGWYEHDDTICIAMEYFPLGDLNDYLSVSPPVPEVEAKELVFQLLEGVNFLHGNGFAHRDLKPSNVLVKAKPPEKWWIKIGDFGISKRAAAGSIASSTLKGTIGFMPPELHGFVDQVDCYNQDTQDGACAADMWALGELTFQLLTKKVCFKNMRLLDAYVTKSDLFPVDALQECEVSSDGVELIRLLMQPAPRRRIDAEGAINHIWVAPCKVPSPRPLSLASFGSSDVDGDLFPEDDMARAEPSGRWSTGSVHWTGEHDTQEKDSVSMVQSVNTAMPALQHLYKNTGAENLQDDHMKITTKLAAAANSESIQKLPQVTPQLGTSSQVNRRARSSPTDHSILSNDSPKSGREFNNRTSNSTEKQNDDRPLTKNNPPSVHPIFAIENPSPAPSLPKPSPEKAPFDVNAPYVPRLVLDELDSNSYKTSKVEDKEAEDVGYFIVSEDGSGHVLDELGNVAGQVLDDLRGRSLGRQVTPIMSGPHCVGWRTADGVSFDDSNVWQHGEIDYEEDTLKPTWPMEGKDVVKTKQNRQRLTLSSSRFVMDPPQTPAFLSDIPHASEGERDEFTHYRYTAVTCQPQNFAKDGYVLRPSLFVQNRHTDVLVSLDFQVWPSEPHHLHELMREVRTAFNELCKCEEYVNHVKPRDPWKSIVVLLIGPTCTDDTSSFLDQLGLVQDWTRNYEFHGLEAVNPNGYLAASVNRNGGPPQQIGGNPVTAHLYEYTTQKRAVYIEQKFRGIPSSIPPMQLILCVSDRRDIPSIGWQTAICLALDAKLIIVYDINDTIPAIRRNAWVSSWKNKRDMDGRRIFVDGSNEDTSVVPSLVPSLSSMVANTRFTIGKMADKWRSR